MAPRSDRLTPQDAGYLQRETASQPMHFVLQVDVGARPDGTTVTLDEVRDHLAGRLDRVPALRRRVLQPPLGIGRPLWVDDPRFDLERHVVAWDLPAPNEDGVRRALEVVTSEHVDTRYPLWRLHVGPRLDSGQAPLALSVHHAFMDGGLLSSVMADLFGTVHDSGGTAWVPSRPPAAARLLFEGVAEAVRHRLGGARSRAAAGPPAAAAAAPRRGVLTGPVGPVRAVAGLSVPLSWLRRLRHATGATINDLYLTAVAAGLEAVLDARTDSPAVDELLTLVPRDVRTAEESRTAGNRTWSMLVSLPLHAASPQQRLAAVRAATAQAKAAGHSSGNAALAFDVALSNVKMGRDHAVAGAPVLRYRATAPLQGTNRLLAVALSYDDTFTITFTADAYAVPEVEALAEATQAGFEELGQQPAAAAGES